MPVKTNNLRQVEEPEPPPAPRRSYVPPVYKENENYDDRLGGFIQYSIYTIQNRDQSFGQ
jgi:hypothetical protein